MMKSVKYIVLASAICAIVYGCGLDYNESSIYSKDEMFRQRTEGVDKLVWGIYGQLDYDCGYNWTYGAMLSSASDESICPWAESTMEGGLRAIPIPMPGINGIRRYARQIFSWKRRLNLLLMTTGITRTITTT